MDAKKKKMLDLLAKPLEPEIQPGDEQRFNANLRNYFAESLGVPSLKQNVADEKRMIADRFNSAPVGSVGKRVGASVFGKSPWAGPFGKVKAIDTAAKLVDDGKVVLPTKANPTIEQLAKIYLQRKGK